jgi:cation transporter-like permease
MTENVASWFASRSTTRWHWLMELRDRHERASRRVRVAWFASILIGAIAGVAGWLV